MVAPAAANRLNGANVAPPKTETEVTADKVQLALRSRFNPIRGLTPQLLATYLDQFYLGYIAYAALVWDTIERRDDVLKGVAAKRRKAVSRLEWQVLTPDELTDDPDATAHKEALEEFYNNITVVNALDENERGGFSLLVRQMMDAVGKYYAVHEIVWQPGAVLTAELRFVPLWFFENRTGRLRFMSIPLGGIDGQPLEDGGWMITKGDGLMEACSVAYMFKNLPLKDWVAYSDKFGTPGVLGQTNAAKGSDAGNAMRDAVANFGQNWSGVVYGADGAIKEPLSLVTAGTSGASGLPFPPLIERMDRAMTSLWRGSDLSSMSGHGSGANTGASVQGDETDILLWDDATSISDTLQIYIDRWVIEQKFGRGVKPLAYVKLVVPEKQNVDQDLKVTELLLNAGARIGEKERLEYFGLPVMDERDTALHAPAHVMERITPGAGGGKGGKGGATPPVENPAVATLSNSESLREPSVRVIAADADLETYLGKYRDEFLKAFANDLQPLRTAMEAALQDVEHGPDMNARLIMLRSQLPDILKEINQKPRTAGVMAEIMANAFKIGWETKP